MQKEVNGVYELPANQLTNAFGQSRFYLAAFGGG